MKYEKKEALTEIRRRGRLIKKQHDKKITQFLSMATFVATVALICSLSVFMGAGVTHTQSEYGSMLLPVEYGGYILVAVLAFAFGVMLTLVLQWYRKKKDIEVQQ